MDGEITNEMAAAALNWIVHDIAERSAEAQAEQNDAFTEGRALAYFEVMDMIESRLAIYDIHLSDFADEKPS